MKDLMNIDVKNELTMTSKEISELTGISYENLHKLLETKLHTKVKCFT